MKRLLRFLCFASLLAIILLGGTSNQGELSAQNGGAKPPTPDGSAGETACSNLHDSATITITFTPSVKSSVKGK